MKLKDTEIVKLDLKKESSHDFDIGDWETTSIDIVFKNERQKYSIAFNQVIYDISSLDLINFFMSYDCENKTKDEFLLDLEEQFKEWIINKGYMDEKDKKYCSFKKNTHNHYGYISTNLSLDERILYFDITKDIDLDKAKQIFKGIPFDDIEIIYKEKNSSYKLIKFYFTKGHILDRIEDDIYDTIDYYKLCS